MKLTDHTCACNELTSFWYKTHPPETEIVVNLQKFAWKNSWNPIKWTYLWRVLPIWNHCVLGQQQQLLIWPWIAVGSIYKWRHKCKFAKTSLAKKIVKNEALHQWMTYELLSHFCFSFIIGFGQGRYGNGKYLFTVFKGLVLLALQMETIMKKMYQKRKTNLPKFVMSRA